MGKAVFFCREVAMANANVAAMSVDAILRLGQDIWNVLTGGAHELKAVLARLGHEVGFKVRESSLKGRSVPVKYRDKSGNTWAGQGAQQRRSKAGRLCSS